MSENEVPAIYMRVAVERGTVRVASWRGGDREPSTYQGDAVEEAVGVKKLAKVARALGMEVAVHAMFASALEAREQIRRDSERHQATMVVRAAESVFEAQREEHLARLAFEGWPS